MTNNEIIDLYEGLYEISQNPDFKLNAKTCFVLAKNKNLLQPFYDSVIEARQKLIEKYGERQEDGNWFISNEKLIEFKTEFKSLMNIQTFLTIENIALVDLENEKINLELMRKLLPIIK